ncbi:flagellar hook-basal body complex protein, partial [Roseateles sp. GG27B]
MSFQQGLSGLNAASKNLDVIGNNIANAGTYGAKSSRAEFQDVYAGALNGAGASPIGIGVNLATVAQQFTQGNISTTSSPMDLAINGGGFFQVTDGVNPVQYSRNGQFKLDKSGFIVNNAQLKLLGYPADAKGLIQPGLAKPLQLPTSGIAPNPTTKAALELNLDSRSLITNPVGLATKNAADALVAQTVANAAAAANPNSANTQAAANATNKVTTTAAQLAAATAAGVQINLKDPTTYNNATSLTAYDAKGQEVAVTMYFQKSAPDPVTGGAIWNIYATAN